VKSFKKIENSNTETSKLQDNVESSLKQITSKDILNGVLLKNIRLTSGSNTINHKLGRQLIGFIVIRQRAQAQIWDSQDDNSLKNLTLILNSSANVEIDLWCF